MRTSLISILFAAALVTPAAAQDIEALQAQINALQKQLNELAAKQGKQAAAQPKVKWEPAPSISSPDGEYEMNMRGRLYFDAGWVNDDDDVAEIKATETRTARIGIEGKAGGGIKYRFEANFGGNEVSVQDAFISLSAAGGTLKVGHFKPGHSLTEATSSRFTTFMERAAFTDSFGFARNLGVGYFTNGDDWSANISLQRGGMSTSSDDEGYVIAGRATWSPKFDGVQAHFGTSMRHREIGNGQAAMGYSQRPHSHLADKFLSTASLSKSDTFFGLETAMVKGPFAAQAEYSWLKTNLLAPEVGANDPTFKGGYAEVSYFITGEKRGYKASSGGFSRVKVLNPIGKGAGAWQVAARYDTIDLSDENVFGGEQSTWTLGLNWHLNNYTRIMMNYAHSDIDNAFDSGLNGLDGKNKVDTFGIRAQIDW